MVVKYRQELTISTCQQILKELWYMYIVIRRIYAIVMGWEQ